MPRCAYFFTIGNSFMHAMPIFFNCNLSGCWVLVSDPSCLRQIHMRTSFSYPLWKAIHYPLYSFTEDYDLDFGRMLVMCDHLSSVLLFQVLRYYSPAWWLLSFVLSGRFQAYPVSRYGYLVFCQFLLRLVLSPARCITSNDLTTMIHVRGSTYSDLDTVLGFPRLPLILRHPQYYPVMCPSGRSHQCSHSSFVDDYLHTSFSQRIFPTVVPSASNFTYAVHCCLWLLRFQAELPNHHFAMHQIADSKILVDIPAIPATLMCTFCIWHH